MQRHTQSKRGGERKGGGRYMKIYATASNCGVGDGPEISTIVFPFSHFLARSFFLRCVCSVYCVCGALGCSLVEFGTIHDYYLHSAIIEGHCLICMWVRSHWLSLCSSPTRICWWHIIWRSAGNVCSCPHCFVPRSCNQLSRSLRILLTEKSKYSGMM